MWGSMVKPCCFKLFPGVLLKPTPKIQRFLLEKAKCLRETMRNLFLGVFLKPTPKIQRFLLEKAKCQRNYEKLVSWRFLETNPKNSAVPFGESKVSQKLIGFKRQKQNAFAGLSGCSNSGLRPQIEIARRRYHEFGNLQSPQISSSRIIVLSIVTTCHNYLFVINLFNEVCFYSFMCLRISTKYLFIIWYSSPPCHSMGAAAVDHIVEI